MRNTSSKSTLFLMEIAVAILFFFLGCSVCLKGFAQARLISQDSHNLLGAMQQMESIVTCIQVADGDTDLLEAQLQAIPPVGELQEPFSSADFLLFYDKEWRPTTQKEGKFVATISKSTQRTGLFSIEVLVLPENKPLLQQEIFVHQPQTIEREVTP